MSPVNSVIIKKNNMEHVKSGMVIIPYEFDPSIHQRAKTKRAMAPVLNRDRNDLNLQYGEPLVELSWRFSLKADGQGKVQLSVVVTTLPYPILKRSMYEFKENMPIDVV